MKTINQYINESLINKDSKINTHLKLKDDQDTFDRIWELLIDIFIKVDTNGTSYYQLIKEVFSNNIVLFMKKYMVYFANKALVNFLNNIKLDDRTLSNNDIYMYISLHNDELLKEYEDWKLD